MKRIIFLVSMSLCFGCGQMEDSQTEIHTNEQAITYGTTVGDTPASRPVVRMNINGKMCTGTLIADRWILTAAHCLPGCPNGSKACGVTSGMLSAHVADMDGEQVSIYLDRVTTIPHPDYRTSDDKNDIGLVYLQKPLQNEAVSFGYRMRLMNRQTWKGAKFESYGWGFTSHWDTETTKVLKMNRRRVAWIGDERFGTWASSGSPGANCKGDSGGPAVRQYSGAPPVQFGVMSRGETGPNDQCTPEDGWNHFTLIAPKIEWIKSKLGSICFHDSYEYQGDNVFVPFLQCFKSPAVPFEKPTRATEMGQCSVSQPCNRFEIFDCDSDAQCATGLACGHNIGANYGLPADADLCIDF